MTFDFIQIGLILRFGINITAMTVLIFGMFYLRYRDKELVNVASLFSIVSTDTFLAAFGVQPLRDLPDPEKAEDAGLAQP